MTKSERLFKYIAEEMGASAPVWIVGMSFNERTLRNGEEVLVATLLIDPVVNAIRRSAAFPHKREIMQGQIADFFGRLALTSWPDIRYVRKSR